MKPPNFGIPTDDIEQIARDWLIDHLCQEAEGVMKSLARLIKEEKIYAAEEAAAKEQDDAALTNEQEGK